VWFIKEHLGIKAKPLDQLPRIVSWMDRIKAIGHGTRTDIPGSAALDIAKSATPAAVSVDGNDPSGLKAGQKLTVTPDDTGKVPVSGVLVGLKPDRISLVRTDPRVGEVIVHFPRAGYFVAPAG
jgi:glutathione S-transferase